MLDDIRALPVELDESIKWRNPNFDRDGAVVKWFLANEWINVIFYKGHLLDDRDGCFEPTDNIRMRTIKITEARPLDRSAWDRLLRAAVECNTPDVARPSRGADQGRP
jgi:hypothetical protein